VDKVYYFFPKEEYELYANILDAATGDGFGEYQKKQWANWQDKDYLALVRENQGRESFSFILLDARIARALFERCSISNGSRKINLGFYVDASKPHIHEWPDFPIFDYIHELPITDTK